MFHQQNDRNMSIYFGIAIYYTSCIMNLIYCVLAPYHTYVT